MDRLYTSQTWITDNKTHVYGSYGERVFYASLLAGICVVGTVGNCLVIAAVCVCKKLRTRTNAMVVNLSVADLISCVNLPWLCVAILSEDGWLLPSWLCKSQGVIVLICTGCSLYTLSGIAVSRCCLITMSRARYYKLFTAPNIAAMIMFCWLVPMSVTAIAFSFGADFFGYGEKYSLCLWNTEHPRIKTFNAILTVVFYPIPLIAIIISSVKIYRFVRRSTRRIANATSFRDNILSVSGGNVVGNSAGNTAVAKNNPFNRRQMAVTKNLFLVIAVFLLLLSPYEVLLVIETGEKITVMAGVTLLSNSCVNPLIYARHPDFKVVFQQLLRCKAMGRGIP